MPDSPFSRRSFLKHATAAGAASFAAFPNIHAQRSPANKLRVGVMGLKRGLAHIRGFQAVPDVEIAYVCDIDKHRLAEGVKLAEAGQSTSPKAVTDFRNILDDASVDILSIAAPNFWHAPASILACQAGKHAYVEKPGSYDPQEAEWVVAAARKYDKKVQLGTQRRSYQSMIEGMSKLREGLIGEIRFARTWYNNARGSIGHGKKAAPPSHIDYDLWQGPAPRRSYRDNLVHYNWHWVWHYGGGELINNGVHALDLARWGLGIDYPSQVTYLGGRYHFDDDQESPDTGVAQFHFGDKGASWDGSSCLRRKEEDLAFCSFYGDGGSVAFDFSGYRVFDTEGKMIEEREGTPGDVPHFENHCDAIRKGVALNQDIEEGQKSALWCHLGNIAYRTDSVLDVDPKTGRILGNPAAQKLWGRNYQKEWKPTV